MRIAVVSDTHLPRGQRRLPDRCVEELRAADLILHAGDFATAGVQDQVGRTQLGHAPLRQRPAPAGQVRVGDDRDPHRRRRSSFCTTVNAGRRLPVGPMSAESQESNDVEEFQW